MEGRPPGEIFAHQRWDEFFPKVGYVMSLGQVAANQCFHPAIFPSQNPNSRLDLWHRPLRLQHAVGDLPPPLIKGRYGEPIITRIYNNMPVDRAQNGGFGRNEHQLHFHNAHNGAESDGATNVHHFPGTFYDYRWSTTLARRDKIKRMPPIADARAARTATAASSTVPGDYREYPGHHVGPRPPLLLHRRECLQRQCS